MNEKLTDDFDKEMKNSFCCSRKYIIKKLVTKEDPIFLHKFLGAFAIFSYIYRFYYILPTTGTLGFDGSWFDHFSIFMHIALSTSSLIFHVLKQRILKRPLVIWHEYRLHTISFTMRGVAVYLFAYFWPYEQHTDFQHMCLWPVVIGWHVIADEITRRHGPADPNQTTVRGKSDGEGNSHMSKVPKSVLRFYAFFQFCALGSQLLPNDRLMDLGYNPIIGVQSSAFLMTLFRKGLIKWYTHAFWYTTALLMAGTVFMLHMRAGYYMTLMFCCFYMRVNFGLSKYLIWFCYGVVSLPTVEKTIWNCIDT
jgi:hypothetical protein